MTIAARLPARAQHKCDACGKLGFEFARYSSAAIDEACPQDALHACGAPCMKIIKEKVSSGAFVIPTLKATPGYFKVSKPRKGY